MPVIRQSSFAGGELAPTLYSRSDLAKYAVGLKRARNFFIGRHGTAYSRPGTTYCGTVKTSSDGRVRLIPFIYSNSASYVLEFGNNYIRFYKNGAVIGGPLEVVTPYTTADLPKLKFAQQGAVLTLTHSAHPPAELKWDGTDTGWTYAAISFSSLYPGPTTGIKVLAQVNVAGDLPQIPAVWANGTTYPADARVRVDSTFATRYFTSLQSGNVGHNPISASDNSIYWVEDTTHAPLPLQWAVTAIVQLPDGTMVETLPSFITKYDNGAGLLNMPGMVACYPDQPIVINASTSIGSAGTGTSSYPLWGLRFYKGVQPIGQGPGAGKVGLIATVAYQGAYTNSAVNTQITDNGIVPDYTQSPPQGLNPFTASAARYLFHTNTFNSANDYPSCVTFYEQRRIFAGTPARPEFFFCSASDDFYDFDDPALLSASAAIYFGLASRKMEEIRGLVSVGPKLLAATSASVWSVGGSSGPLAFNDIDAKRQGEVGSSWVDPLVVDGSLLIIRSKGTGIRSLTEDYVRQTYTESDLSIYANHLFINHTVVDWAYAEDPWSLVWAIRDDGILLSCAYLKEQETLAWGWHDSQGLFENICTVPEGVEDAVYFVVNRGGTRFIERLASRVFSDIKNYIGLDCCKTYNSTPTTSITGMTWLNGKTVYALADGIPVGPFVVSGGAITLPTAASVVCVGLPFTPELQLLDAYLASAELKTTERIVNRIGFEVDNSRGLMVGPDFNNLTEWEQRVVQDAYSAIPLESSLVRQYVLGNWGTDGDACVRQTQPLPVTLLSITREVSFGDPV